MESDPKVQRKPGETVVVSVVIPEDELPHPDPVNVVAISRVGSLVQMVPAFIDLNRVATLNERWRAGEDIDRQVKAMPLHRLVLDAEAFDLFKHRVDEIHAALVTEGRIPRGAK